MNALFYLSSIVVLVEALNKLERLDVLRATGWECFDRLLLMVGWISLAIGAGSVLITPFLAVRVDQDPVHVLMIIFAGLIIRARVMEVV